MGSVCTKTDLDVSIQDRFNDSRSIKKERKTTKVMMEKMVMEDQKVKEKVVFSGASENGISDPKIGEEITENTAENS